MIEKRKLLNSLGVFSDVLVFVFILCLITTVYSNSLYGAFVSDDILGLRDNDLVHDVGEFLKVNYSKFGIRTYFEMLPQATYAIVWHFSKDDVFWHHLLSVLLHFLNCMLVYILILRLFGKRGLAFLSALFFALHTINNQSVAWISARPYLLACLFYLSSLIFFIKGISARNIINAILFYMLSLICALESFYIHIETITLPFIIMFLNSFFLKKTNKEKKFSRIFILPYFLFFILFSFYLVLKVKDRIGSYAVIAAKYDINMWLSSERIIIIAKSIQFYLELLFLPIKLGFYYPGFFEYSKLMGNFDLWAISPFVIITGMLIFAFYCMRKFKELSFGFFWLFITLIPFTPIIYLHAIVAERYAYLASIGFCLVLAYIINSMFKNVLKQKYLSILLRISSVICAIVIICFYGFLDIQRNKVWLNEFSLYSAEVKNFPESKFAHNNLGTVLSDSERAIEEFKKAIALDPLYAEPRYNLANRYAKLNRLKEAEQEYRKTILLVPDWALPYNNLAMIYLAQGKLKEAEDSLKRAQELNPQLSLYHSNLGLVYIQKKQLELAFKEFKKSLELDPKNRDAKNYLKKIGESIQLEWQG